MQVLQSLHRASRPVVSSPAGLVLAGLVGIGLALPSLGIGFYLDDYAQLALVESWYPQDAGTFNLYSFLGELPLDPWWKHPEFKVSMWRPFPSALLHLDNRLFGHNAMGYHAHSILWFAALLAAVGLLFARLLPARLSVLALLIFSLDECHILNVGWIANRHAIVAMVPALLGLGAHIRWREDAWRPGLPLSILGYGVGLFGGEVALSVMAYAAAYELFASPATGRRRLVGLVPLVAVGGCYAIWYKAAGFGASNSGFYLDPPGEPMAFLAGAAGHIPALLAAALAGFPADLWFFVPAARPAQIAVGLAAVVAFALLLRSAWPRSRIRWR